MRFHLLCISSFLFAVTLLNSRPSVKTEASNPVFCDSIYIDSVNIYSEQPFPDYLTFYFRNEGTVLSAYPILGCSFEMNPYYGSNEKDISIISLFDKKGGFSNGRTVFHFQLSKSTPASSVPDDFVLKGTASIRFLNDQTQIYDTCTFGFDLKPGTKKVMPVEEPKQNNLTHIVVSPNPAVNLLTIQYPKALQSVTTIDITNIYGIVCKSLTSIGNIIHVDIGDLPSGYYMIRTGELTAPFLVIR